MGYIYHLNNVCFFPSVIFLFPINSYYTSCIGKQIPFHLCYGMVIKASLYFYNIKDSSTFILQVLRISDLHLINVLIIIEILFVLPILYKIVYQLILKEFLP